MMVNRFQASSLGSIGFTVQGFRGGLGFRVEGSGFWGLGV